MLRFVTQITVGFDAPDGDTADEMAALILSGAGQFAAGAYPRSNANSYAPGYPERPAQCVGEAAKRCPECKEAPSINGGRCIDCRGASMVDLAHEGSS